MGETESAGRNVKNNKVKHAAGKVKNGDGEVKRGSRGKSSKRNGSPSEQVVPAEAMELDGVDGMSLKLGSLSLTDDRNCSSRSSGTVLNEVPLEFAGTMGSEEAFGTSSGSYEGDEGDSSTDLEGPCEQEEISTTLSREDSTLLAELMQVIQRGGDLKKLKINHLKAYLRHHGLRISGVKEVLLNRIEQHLIIKEGQGEVIYPRSSFTINCQGDVCLGDTVLFSQNVYEAYDVVKRGGGGPSLGKRWVAGKVVNESYGAEKQQHTFTIEVLWSTGVNPFYAMRPLQIKGRNLYRMHTSRQPWIDEKDRENVLAEKHARGAEARVKRRVATSSRGSSRSRPGSRGKSKTRHQGGSSRSVPPATQSSIDQDRNLIPHNIYAGNSASSSLARDRPVESRPSEQNIYQGISSTTMASSHTHLLQNSTQQGRAVQRQISNVARPSSVIHAQGILHIECSNRGCDKSGAKSCITQSCAACCFKDGSSRGKCSRHQ